MGLAARDGLWFEDGTVSQTGPWPTCAAWIPCMHVHFQSETRASASWSGCRTVHVGGSRAERGRTRGL